MTKIIRRGKEPNPSLGPLSRQDSVLLLTYPLLCPPVPLASPAGTSALRKNRLFFFHLCYLKNLLCFLRFSEGPGNHLWRNEIFVSGNGNAGCRTRAGPRTLMFRPVASRFPPAWFCAAGWESAGAWCQLGCRWRAPVAGCSATGIHPRASPFTGIK